MDNKFENKEYVAKYIDKVKEAIKSLDEKFEKYKEASEEEISKPLDKTELISEVNKTISMLHRYITKLADESITLEKYKDKLVTMESELYDYFRFHWDKSTKLTEGAISKYVEGHEIYRNLNSVVVIQKGIVTYLQNVVDAIKSRHFSIKYAIDVKKMELNIT